MLQVEHILFLFKQCASCLTLSKNGHVHEFSKRVSGKKTKKQGSRSSGSPKCLCLQVQKWLRANSFTERLDFIALLPHIVMLLDVDLVKHHILLLGIYICFHLHGNMAGKHREEEAFLRTGDERSRSREELETRKGVTGTWILIFPSTVVNFWHRTVHIFHSSC